MTLKMKGELGAYIKRLSVQLRLSEHNVKLHAHSPSLASFVTLHITWHGAQSILYRLALDGLAEALPRHVLEELDPSFVTACQQRCFETAKSMAKVLAALLSLKLENASLDLDMAVSVYQCLRMLIYSHRALDGVVLDTADDVDAHCRACVEFLGTMLCDYEAIKDIKRDAGALVKGALSPLEGTPDSEVENEPPRANSKQGSQNRHHVLSKHSLVGQIEVPDKKESFLISPSPSDSQFEGLQTADMLPQQAPQNSYGSSVAPAFSPSMDILSTPLRDLSELCLPDFELDSSILLPNSWPDSLPLEHDGYL